MKENHKLALIITFLTITLSIIGVISIYSSSSIWADYLYNDKFFYFKRQFIFLIIGLAVFFISSKINLNFLKKHAFLLLIISYVLLLLVLIPGLGTLRNGSRSWFVLGGIGFQPAELFKVTMIIYASFYLEKNYRTSHYFFKRISPLLFLALLGFGIIMLQPDFGTGIVMMATIVVLTLISKVSLKNYVKIGIMALVALTFIIISEPYRIERIYAFVDPWSDPLGSGFQTIQALLAIGPGGFLGLGWDNSIQKHYFLPEPQTDFIFAIICEEIGFIGGLLIILTFGMLIYYTLKVAIKSLNKFDMFLSFGIASLISIQVIINLGVVVGLLPVTGITLPFISYGGTSLLILFFLMGLVVNIAKRSDLSENCYS